MSDFEELDELKQKATVRHFSHAAQLKDGSWLMGSYYGTSWVWFEPDMETVRFEIHHDELLLNPKTETRKEFERLLSEVSDAESD